MFLITFQKKDSTWNNLPLLPVARYLFMVSFRKFTEIYRTTEMENLRHILVDDIASIDDKVHIISCEHLLRGGQSLSKSRRLCLKFIVMDPYVSHDELYDCGFSRYVIKANSKMLRKMDIWKPRGYPCSAKTKRGSNCRNRSKYNGRKCHVHKTIHDPSLFFYKYPDSYYDRSS